MAVPGFDFKGGGGVDSVNVFLPVLAKIKKKSLS